MNASSTTADAGEHQRDHRLGVSELVAEQGQQQVAVGANEGEDEDSCPDQQQRPQHLSPRREVHRVGGVRVDLPPEVGRHEDRDQHKAGDRCDEVDEEGGRSPADGDQPGTEQRAEDASDPHRATEQAHRPGAQVHRHLVGDVGLAAEVPGEVAEAHQQDRRAEQGRRPDRGRAGPVRPGGEEAADDGDDAHEPAEDHRAALTDAHHQLPRRQRADDGDQARDRAEQGHLRHGKAQVEADQRHDGDDGRSAGGIEGRGQVDRENEPAQQRRQFLSGHGASRYLDIKLFPQGWDRNPASTAAHSVAGKRRRVSPVSCRHAGDCRARPLAGGDRRHRPRHQAPWLGDEGALRPVREARARHHPAVCAGDQLQRLPPRPRTARADRTRPAAERCAAGHRLPAGSPQGTQPSRRSPSSTPAPTTSGRSPPRTCRASSGRTR